MRLKFHIPGLLEITAPTREGVVLQAHFDDDPYTVSYRLAGDHPVEVPAEEPEERFKAACTHIEFSVDDHDRGQLRAWVESQAWNPLVSALLDLANRVLRQIRNVGMAVHIAEWTVEPADVVTRLHQLTITKENIPGTDDWQLVSLSAADWSDLLLSLWTVANVPTFTLGRVRAQVWPDIVYAVQHNLEPQPEREFTANALQYMRFGNLRHALLEAVICLEIVLNRYMRTYLRQKEIPEATIDILVGVPESFFQRVDAACRTLSGSRPVDAALLSRVAEAIRWRALVRATGHIPGQFTTARPAHHCGGPCARSNARREL